MTTIEVTGLRKRFGPTQALDGMTFTVAPGEVTGFVGPNGAGKSTTMRVILGLDAADEGRATVGGRSYASLRQPMRVIGSLLDAGALQASRSARNHLLWLARSGGRLRRRRRVMGALLAAGALHPSRSARNHLLWLAHSQGLDARRVDEVVGQAGLQSAIKRRAGGYSLGMRQRLGIAGAAAGGPAVLVVGEE